MNEIKQQLQNAGLSKSEVKVYLYLLKEGVSSPSQIAKGTKIARTNTYHILRELDDRDLIERRKKGKRFVYIASDPRAVIHEIDKRKEALESILPDLYDLFQVQRNKPAIRYFDGREQIKEIYLETLTAEEEIYAVGSAEHLNTFYPKFSKEYVRKLKQKKLYFHDILTHHSSLRAAHDVMGSQIGIYHKVRYLNNKESDFPTDILIWNNNVALISFSQPAIGIVITREYIAKTFRAMFKTMWLASNRPT